MDAPSYLSYYAEALGHGRAIMLRDVVIDGELVAELSGPVGSPAPIETVRAHEYRVSLNRKDSA